MRLYKRCCKSLILLWLMICIISSGDLLSQNNAENSVASISFQGIDKNKESYLRQFIKLKLGDSPVDSLLQEDVQRLKNIPSIGNAYFTIDTSYNSLEVIFKTEELKLILPILNFGTVTNNNWIQLGFSDNNWQGNGSSLSAVYQNKDNRHGGQIFYRAPRILGTDWGLSASLNRSASIEPLFFNDEIIFFDYTNHEAGLSVIKQLGYRHQIEIGGTYFKEKFVNNNNQNTESIAEPLILNQPKFLSKIEYTLDYIDHHFFYQSGMRVNLGIQNVITFSDKSWFRSLYFTGTFFSIINETANLAIRLTTTIATNNDTPFAPYVIDSHVNIRGVGNRIARGTAKLIANIEYRITTHESKRWGVQTVAFLDMGTWRNPGQDLGTLFQSNQSRQFVGGGFRFIYKKFHGAILRVDYGINVQDINQGGLVIGFGQYF